MARNPARYRRLARLNDLLAPLSEDMRVAFLSSISDIVSNVNIDRAIAALERGNIDDAISALNISRAAFGPVDRQLAATFTTGGTATATSLQGSILLAGAPMVVRFDGRNPAAEYWLSKYSGDKIKDLTNDQITMARNHMQETLMAGQNPRAVITDLVGKVDRVTRARTGGLLGLTDYQAQLVRNAENQLRSGGTANLRAYLSRSLRDKRFDRTILKHIRTKEPLSDEQIARMVQSYRNRYLAYRAENIGRTETMTALHEGQDQAVRQAVAQGNVQPHMVRRTWRTAMDKDVRDTHSDMEGQTVGLDEPFLTGANVPLRFPGDPEGPAEEIINCRCDVFIRIDYMSNFGPAR